MQYVTYLCKRTLIALLKALAEDFAGDGSRACPTYKTGHLRQAKQDKTRTRNLKKMKRKHSVLLPGFKTWKCNDLASPACPNKILKIKTLLKQAANNISGLMWLIRWLLIMISIFLTFCEQLYTLNSSASIFPQNRIYGQSWMKCFHAKAS